MKNTKDINKDSKIIVDENCFLKILKKSDVTPKYISWLNDYEVTKFTEQKYFNHTYESVLNFVIEKYKSEQDFLFGIFFKNSHIGNVKLGPIKWEHKSAEISYFIGEKEFWGKGIATKCIKKLVQFGIKELFLEKVNAGYYEKNIGSGKVLKNCGFEIEGIRKSDVIFENQRIKSILVGYVKHRNN